MTTKGDDHTQRIRVALAITELEIGGAERCLVNLATRMDRSRFDVAVYSLAPPPESGRGQLVEQLEAAGIPVHFIGVRSRWQLWTAVARLRKLLAQQSPHLLQTFLFHANVVGPIAAQGKRKTVVVTGIRVADPTVWRMHVERLAAHAVDRIVCVSQSVAQFVQSRMGLAARKLVVIPNGIDLSRYPAESAADLSQFGIKPTRRTIVYVGRLDRQKGTDWLVELSPRLLDKLPDHDLLLVGDGPQRRWLEMLAASQACAGRIHFAGWRPDITEILKRCDLVILPSRWEGMPNAVLEAMASGLPVVATQVAGVHELLGPLAERQTVAPNDANSLIAKVVNIAQDRALADSLGRQNQLRVTEHFCLGRMISTYERLYESLVSMAESRVLR